MGYLANIIRDARRTVPAGVVAGPAVVSPAAEALPMEWDASPPHGQRGEEPGSVGDTAAVQASAPAVSGIAASDYLSVAVPGIPLDASPPPSYAGLSPAPPQKEEHAGDGVFPPAGERRSPSPHGNAGFVRGSTVQPQGTPTPIVPERSVEAAGEGVGRHGKSALAPLPPLPSRSGSALPHASGRHEPALSAGAHVGEPSPSLPPVSQEYSQVRLDPADSSGTVAPPRTVTAGDVEVAADERQASALPLPLAPVAGTTEHETSSPLPPLYRDDPNGVEARIWPQEYAAAHRTVIEPRVHIGRIDIVVQAPESPRQAPSPATSPSDLASRLYLRRL